MMKLRIHLLYPLLLALLLAAPLRAEPRAAYGQVFPAASYQNLIAGTDGAAPFDMTGVVGKVPVVLCYWIAGHERSERALLRLQEMALAAGPDKLRLLSVVAEQPGREAPQIVARAREIGVKVPVLNDAGFKLGGMLGVRSVPNISVLDAKGRWMLGNAGSLKQPVEYKLDVEGVVHRLIETGNVGAYGPMPKYYPVVEMIGKKCPDFRAAEVGNGMQRRWYNLLADDMVNVLVFWHVECGHCKKTMPEINTWLKEHPSSKINLVSAAQVRNDVEKAKTEEFCKFYDFVFPTLADRDRTIAESFQVTATPTILFVRSDGVIDSVLTEGNFQDAFESKVKELREKS